jgi:hypothetical protein
MLAQRFPDDGHDAAVGSAVHYGGPGQLHGSPYGGPHDAGHPLTVALAEALGTARDHDHRAATAQT